MTIEKLKSMEPLFDSWYVGSKLAEGKNSKVYKVFRTVNDEEQQMCVKTVKFPSDENELSKIIDSGKYKNVDEYLSILENVIRYNMDKMLSLKNHPNIVSFEDYAVIKENSCFYVVMLMEILTPLSHYLKAESIQAKQVIRIGTDLCKALTAFREKGIIHHNIRPENIYVDSFGNHKLGDFGVYEINEDNSVQITSYTAPETYNKSGEDVNSDIYSLGILLYKLLNNNRAPFLPDFPAPISLSDRDTAFSKLMRGETLTPPANADYALSKIIFKACAFNPAERFAFPTELQGEFEYYLQVLSNDPIVSATEQRRNLQHAKTYHLENDNDYYFPGSNARMVGSVRNDVSGRDKDAYQRAFDDDDEIQQDASKKKTWYIVLGLIVIIALVTALILSSGKDDEKDKTTAESTTSQVITTVAPATSAPTSTTKEETTTEETTTEETTTEETTTEETTTEETTTEETTTEETTTEETTTEEPTTEETTTAESTTEPEAEDTTAVQEENTTEPILVFAQNEAGDKNNSGLTYVDIIDYSVKPSMKKGVVTITVKDDLGKGPVVSGDASIQIMMGDISIVPCMCDLTCVDNGNGSYTITVKSIDKDYFYDPNMYQYYVCLEQGALQSDSAITLPLQIRVG